jgi:beta-lactam-binding protein with PASTA domain
VSSDLYSVGVILYEMLTGSLPFDGPTAVAVALKQAKQTPSAPRAINTAVPKSLSDLVMRAIDRSPEERFPNASSMLADVRAIRDALRIGKPISVPQPAVSARVEREEEPEPEGLLARSAYLWLTAAFVLVVLLAGVLTVYVNTRDTKIEVPMIVGMTVEEAMEKAQEAKLTLEQDNPGEIYSNDYEEGVIAFQSPGAHARVDREKDVLRYKISKGPSTKRVPDLTGKLETDAYQIAQDAGFVIGKVTTENSDKVRETAVIRQDPEKDTMVPPGSEINLVLSVGPKDETPPDDTGAAGGRQRNFAVSVRVPSNVTGQQEVRIVVDDDRGETTEVQEFHDPGDQFDQDITGYGDKVRIRIYVSGRIVSDKSY